MINKSKPMIMHIDLNCCFAIIEQQANRLLRGRPVAVSAYSTPRGMVLASSYEAKALGVKLGVNNAEAQKLAPGIVILTPDPSKYREAHRRFRKLLLEFTPDVTPKSIDEFVLDFTGSSSLLDLGSQILDLREAATTSKIEDLRSKIHNERMLEIGRQIKQRVRERLGEWVTVNIGIGTNRFITKYAAGFGKPDGMTLIDYRNLKELFTTDPYKHKPIDLIDIPGINVRYAARLRACGINTPLEFYEADQEILKKRVFKSVVGYYWWARLRGHEVDDRSFGTKSIGHQYALPKKTSDVKDLEKLLMKLCEKVGRRLRKNNFCAHGIHLYLGFSQIDSNGPQKVTGAHRDKQNGMEVSRLRTQNLELSTTRPVGFDNIHRLISWHEGHKLNHRLYATSDIYEAARHVLQRAEIPDSVRVMAITVYSLEPWDPEQLSIFDTGLDLVSKIEDRGKSQIVQTQYRSQEATRRLSDAMDEINNRYGEFVVTPGTMMAMNGEILDRIAFASKPDDL